MTEPGARLTGGGLQEDRWRQRGGLVVAALAWAAVLWLSLPPTIAVFSDDFGYVRSVMETVGHGRPWTNDWLEPWAASLSAISAIIFKITGSFRVATYGVQAVLGGVGLWLFARLLRERGLSVVAAVGWGLVIITNPMLLWKISEFGALPLCLVCLLGAIWAAERKNWVVFLVAWMVAMSSRQSALVWMALPMGVVLQALWAGQSRWKQAVVTMGGIVLVGGGSYWLLRMSMNRTHAQAVMMPDLWANFLGLIFWRHLGLVLGAYVIAVGWGRLVFAGSQFRCAELLRFNWTKLGAMAVVGLFWWGDVRSWVESEHPYWNQGVGVFLFHALCVLALVGWCGVGRAVLNFPHLLAAVALGALLGLRGVIWDYYLLDALVLGFLGAKLANPDAKVPRKGVSSVVIFTGVLWIALLWPQARVGLAIKNVVDHNYGVVVLCEKAMRAGQITADELSVASFGYQGWCLYPYYVRHEGARGGYIADFQNYLRNGSLRMVIEGTADELPSMKNGLLRPNEMLLLSTEASWTWIARRRFSLIRTAEAVPASWPLAPTYSRDTFPLSDQEWRQKFAKDAKVVSP